MKEPNYIQPTSKTRNVQCPCGSGLKLKKCHGSIEKMRAWKVWNAEMKLKKYQVYLKSRQMGFSAQQAVAAGTVLAGGEPFSSVSPGSQIEVGIDLH